MDEQHYVAFKLKSNSMKNSLYLFLTICLFYILINPIKSQVFFLQPDFVFDGESIHQDWVVVVTQDKITAVGPKQKVPAPANATVIDLKGATLLPGLIEGHSHLLLHPYNETSWNDQVLLENEAERVARATVHARKTLEAGFTTVRDLGTEGAGYADIGLRTAIEKGVIPGPRILAAGPAIVAGGSYGPRGFAPNLHPPIAADVADGVEELIKTVRRQIGQGVDLIKVYADYRWGPNNTAMPTFSIEELKTIVETAHSAGREVAAHAATAEGMRRAVLAGIHTIEHGDGGTPEVFRLMVEKGVALCPTLAAGEAISEYQGWVKGKDPQPARVEQKHRTFAAALAAGVTICMGGDVGVFTHGDNAQELELMVEYGMQPLDALKSATSINASVFGWGDRIGSIQPGLLADLVAVEGRPDLDIRQLRKVRWVMQGGMVARDWQR